MDGDKRLGWLATVVFLDLNACPSDLDDDAAFDLVIAVAEERLDVDAIAPPPSVAVNRTDRALPARTTTTIQRRVMLVVMSPIACTVLALLAVTVWQVSDFTAAAGERTQGMVDEQLDEQSAAVYAMVPAQADAVELQVDANLAVLTELGEAAGGFGTVDADPVTWGLGDRAVTLPAFGVGDRWVGQLVEAGTMLRVATTAVEELDASVRKTAQQLSALVGSAGEGASTARALAAAARAVGGEHDRGSIAHPSTTLEPTVRVGHG